jgi:lipid II:glycine glycyltransferase (peptidoglycan interpeptide bridge formation enzyme)
MKLKVEETSSKNRWESYLASQKKANFLQSWNWGQFHQALGKKVFYLALLEKGKIAGNALAVKEEAKRGTYLTVAGGPITDWKNKNYIATLLQFIKQKGLDENCDFIRIRPQENETAETTEFLHSLGWQTAPMHLTADLTIELDLTKSEKQLLAQMRKNTRYEIKKAERLGIKVMQSQNPDDIREFYQNQLYLAKKHHFVPFSFEFLHGQFKAFVKDNQVLLFHAYQNQKLLASAFIIFYNREAVYHYGISTPYNQRLPGSYACQWAAIREAKRRSMQRYNFWGVAPKTQKNHRFAGVSLFKRGFGGQEIQYIPAHDLPLSSKYKLIKLLETVRKKARRL